MNAFVLTLWLIVLITFRSRSGYESSCSEDSDESNPPQNKVRKPLQSKGRWTKEEVLIFIN